MIVVVVVVVVAAHLSICLSASLKTKLFCEAPKFSKLTTPKTKPFYETSFQNAKLSAELTASSFRDFSLHLSKVSRLRRKSDARSYEVLRLSRKMILANP